MGNKLGRRRQVVDDKYTRPQGLYQHRDVDHKKLRKLILDSKLAPCYPGDEDCNLVDLEECPICFLHYPSLNRSRCCTKGICTECFLQMKPPHSARPTQCPFCKTSNYAVEYRGVKTKEEKGKEQIEEQRVIEAKIRMQQQQRHDEEQKMLAQYSSSTVMVPGEVEYRDLSTSSTAVIADKHVLQDDKFSTPQNSFILPPSRHLRNVMNDREGDLDLDLEDLMIKEAILRSIQEQELRNRDKGSNVSLVSSTGGNYISNDVPVMQVGTSSSDRFAIPEAGALNNSVGVKLDSFVLLPNSSCLVTGNEGQIQNYDPVNWAAVSHSHRNGAAIMESEWVTEHGSDVAEAGTSYASSNVTLDSDAGGLNTGFYLPETLDEQMRLAISLSLADARVTRNTQGTPWL